MPAHRFDRQGLLALEPRAFFSFFFDPPSRDNETIGDVVVVGVRGPLEAHGGGFFDSYEQIVGRVVEACSGSSRTVVLRIDSPGGDVAGMLDAAQAIRTRCTAAGKRLIAYVDGKACSAAYALACVADQIVVDAGALVGSIGVISARLDVSAQAAAIGMKVALVTSGERKADGHPHSPITDAELAEQQTIVDALASAFFDHVAAHRKLNAAAVAGLEARTFAGGASIAAGLADAVGTFDSVLALASVEPSAASAAKEGATMDEARKALQAIVDDENADEASKARAKKALAAMDEKDDDSDEKKESKAEGDDEKKEEEEEASAIAAAASVATKAHNHAKRIAKLEAKLEASDRAALFASRPDLDPAVFEGVDLKTVQAIVAKMPKPAAPKPTQLGASTTPAVTRGATQIDTAQPVSSGHASDMDRVMGLSAQAPAVRREGTAVVFSAAGTVAKGGAK